MSADLVGLLKKQTPWVTLACGVALVALDQSDDLLVALEFSRDKVQAGEVWRLWTSSFVHFNGTHLFGNLFLFLLAGSFAERREPVLTRVYYALAPLVIGAVLFTTSPELDRFRGLSGVAAGLVMAMALSYLNDGKRWQGASVALLLATKILFEAWSGRTLLVRFEYHSIIPLPIAHLTGTGCMMMLYTLRGQSRFFRRSTLTIERSKQTSRDLTTVR